MLVFITPLYTGTFVHYMRVHLFILILSRDIFCATHDSIFEEAGVLWYFMFCIVAVSFNGGGNQSKNSRKSSKYNIGEILFLVISGSSIHSLYKGQEVSTVLSYGDLLLIFTT